MVGDIFPFRVVISVRRLYIEDISLGCVYNVFDPGAIDIVLLSCYHPEAEAVGDLSWAVDEVVQLGPRSE